MGTIINVVNDVNRRLRINKSIGSHILLKTNNSNYKMLCDRAGQFGIIKHIMYFI